MRMRNFRIDGGNAFKQGIRPYEHNYKNVDESRREEAKNNIEIALINFHIKYFSLGSSFHRMYALLPKCPHSPSEYFPPVFERKKSRWVKVPKFRLIV